MKRRGSGGEAPRKNFEDTPSTLAQNASPDAMFAGPEKEVLTICKKFYELAYTREFLGKHLFFGLEYLSLSFLCQSHTGSIDGSATVFYESVFVDKPFTLSVDTCWDP